MYPVSGAVWRLAWRGIQRKDGLLSEPRITRIDRMTRMECQRMGFPLGTPISWLASPLHPNLSEPIRVIRGSDKSPMRFG